MSERARPLDAVLAGWDGTHVAPLKACLAAHAGDPGFAATLIARIGLQSDNSSDAATWLLKAALESGLVLDGGQTDALLARLDAVRSPTSTLHLCQVVRLLEVDANSAPGLCAWLEGNLLHDRPFIRAWALDAVVSLARRHPRCTHIADTALATAESDPAASVRARARKLAGVKRARRGL